MSLVYINGLDNEIDGDISKFADNTKINRLMRLESDVTALLTDRDKMNKNG